MKYGKMKEIEKGLIFKSASGITVSTTGLTVYIPSRKVYVHEVQIVQGEGEGHRYLHNLDSAELLGEHMPVA